MKRLICRLLGHDPVRLRIGPRWLEACLRCKEQLDIGVDS